MRRFRGMGGTILGCTLGVFAVALLSVSPSWAQDRGKPRPTHANVRYGPHERNVLDFYKARTKLSTNGTKSSVSNHRST